ncbi:MAG TPA: PHB depolymerase family esterase [Flavisolibacter sp.]|nr:PHB depolymerase family esterase [Flavisolibacter sp.]
MKLLLLALLACCLSCEKHIDDRILVETSPPILKQNFVHVNEVVNGYYSALPSHYSETTNAYPLMIFFHGGGQYGNGGSDLPYILLEGVPELLKDSLFPPSFNVDNRNYSFIIIAPQFTKQPLPIQVLSMVNYMVKSYRVDTSRIYLIGFSEGGINATIAAAVYPYKYAALIPIAGVPSNGDVTSICKNIAESKLPLWVFHNNQDRLVDVRNARQFISLLNSFHPSIPPKYTEFLPFGLGNHDAWTHATDPSFKENGKNIYEWMLQYHR